MKFKNFLFLYPLSPVSLLSLLVAPSSINEHSQWLPISRKPSKVFALICLSLPYPVPTLLIALPPQLLWEHSAFMFPFELKLFKTANIESLHFPISLQTSLPAFTILYPHITLNRNKDSVALGLSCELNYNKKSGSRSSTEKLRSLPRSPCLECQQTNQNIHFCSVGKPWPCRLSSEVFTFLLVTSGSNFKCPLGSFRCGSIFATRHMVSFLFTVSFCYQV